MSVTPSQCDARPTVTFPASRHHRPLAGTKLYCLVTEAHMYINNLPSVALNSGAASYIQHLKLKQLLQLLLLLLQFLFNRRVFLSRNYSR